MKYQNIIDNMTLKEKAAFLSGKSEWQTRDFPRLDIPAIFCSDGPNGVRKQAGAGDHLGINPAVPATCFPTAAAMANSWDEELEQRVGVALGEESMEEDVNVLLGPGLNIKRNFPRIPIFPEKWQLLLSAVCRAQEQQPVQNISL